MKMMAVSGRDLEEFLKSRSPNKNMLFRDKEVNIKKNQLKGKRDYLCKGEIWLMLGREAGGLGFSFSFSGGTSV
jgi:hypothetical protein